MVLKKSLATFPDKVDGQQVVVEKKAKLLYDVIDAHPDAYRVIPDKSVRSRMNICFRVTKVHHFSHSALQSLDLTSTRVVTSTTPKRHSWQAQLSEALLDCKDIEWSEVSNCEEN